MAAAASPLTAPARRGWAPTPHAYFKNLAGVLTGVEFAILGNMIDDTLGAFPRQEWTGQPYSYYARLVNCTDDAAGKAIKHLESEELGLITSRRAGRGKEYRVNVEKFTAPTKRAPRRFGEAALEKLRARRKGPGVAVEPHSLEAAPAAENSEARSRIGESESADSIKVVEKPVENLSAPSSASSASSARSSACPTTCGRTESENITRDKFPVSSPSVVTNEGVTKSIPVLQAGYQATGAKGPSSGAVAELESYCVATITPLMGSVPEKKALARAGKILGEAPVGMLTARITQRLELFQGPKASWGALPLLAEDVAKAHHALKRLRGRAPVVELAEHWRSAAEVRRLHRDAATPEHVRREILLMWPELKTSPDGPKSTMRLWRI